MPAQSVPIDPFAIARSERRLKLYEDDFHNSFDGQLEYLKKPKRFVIFLNNKYDRNALDGKRHPRTRFSLGHELGHLYLEHHVSHLLRGGKSHGSKGEFQHRELMELEADAFASALLMPSRLFAWRLNEDAPSLDRIRELASLFETSLMATLFRAVHLSDFPCALVSVKDGSVRWSFTSTPLMDERCYPPERGPLKSTKAADAWRSFQNGETEIEPGYGQIQSWFRAYDDEDLLGVNVREEYLALPWRDDLLMFLTVDEDELSEARESDDDGDDD